jgi:hypothetical protein
MYPCFRLVGTDACTVDNRVDLLWSDGTTAGSISPTSSASTNYTLAGGNATGALNWDTNITAQDGSMEQHMVRNDLPMPYPVPTVLFPLTVPTGPQQGTGWRGAYLSAPIGPDPWGGAYMVNTAFLSTAPDAYSAGEGRTGTSWNRDVFCLSAGPNKLYETLRRRLGTTQFGTCRGRRLHVRDSGGLALVTRARDGRRVNDRGRMGFTLIELTVVLAVIVTLALILTPSIANSINEARVARARNDCQTIASGMYQFYRDTGFFPVWRVSQNGGAGTPSNRLQVLVSQGNVPSEDVPSL